jgi:hypothetical protein
MPDDAETQAKAAMDKSIEEKLAAFDADADDSLNDDSAEDTTADSATDSDDSDDSQDDSDNSDEINEDDTDSDNADDDSNDDSEEDSDDADFSFRETPANIQNFVAKLERMTPEQRKEKIDSLDPVRNKAELEAIKGKFPDISDSDKFTVSKEEWDNVQKKLAKFENLDKADETMKLLEQLAKDKPKLEDELANRMLKEKYGARSEEVSEDPKFQAAMKSLSKLDLADRLEQASMHSKVAREILIGKEASKQNKLKALKGKKSSSPANGKKEFKHSIATEEGIQERYGERLATLTD